MSQEILFIHQGHIATITLNRPEVRNAMSDNLTPALRRMIIGEHSALLLAGVVLGVISAALAVWPSLHQSSHDLPLRFMAELIVAIVIFGLLVCSASAALALRGRLLDSVRKE